MKLKNSSRSMRRAYFQLHKIKSPSKIDIQRSHPRRLLVKNLSSRSKLKKLRYDTQLYFRMKLLNFRRNSCKIILVEEIKIKLGKDFAVAAAVIIRIRNPSSKKYNVFIIAVMEKIKN